MHNKHYIDVWTYTCLICIIQIFNFIILNWTYKYIECSYLGEDISFDMFSLTC